MGQVRVTGMKELMSALEDLKFSTARGVAQRALKRTLEPVAQTARELAPDDPSTPGGADLKSSIIVSSRQRSSGRGQSGAAKLGVAAAMFVGPSGVGYPQAMIQEFGAKPHRIVPKSKRRRKGKRRAAQVAEGGPERMAFEGANGVVVVSEVRHPGTRPHPYMRPAWDRHEPQMLQALADHLWDEVKKTVARHQARARRLAAQAKSR